MYVEVVPVDARTRTAAAALLGVALDLEEKAQGVAHVQVGVQEIAREVVRIRLAVHGAIPHTEARVVLEALTHVAAEGQVHAAIHVKGDELERVQPVGALGRVAQVGIILLVAQDIVDWRLIGESLGSRPGGIEKLLGTLLGAGIRHRAEEGRPRQTGGHPPFPNVRARRLHQSFQAGAGP